jgi:hypothetical protein
MPQRPGTKDFVASPNTIPSYSFILPSLVMGHVISFLVNYCERARSSSIYHFNEPRNNPVFFMELRKAIGPQIYDSPAFCSLLFPLSSRSVSRDLLKRFGSIYTNSNQDRIAWHTKCSGARDLCRASPRYNPNAPRQISQPHSTHRL